MFLLWVKEAEKEIEIPPRAMDSNTRTPKLPRGEYPEIIHAYKITRSVHNKS